MLKYVIIGGGAAALSCIEGIRSIDKTGGITLVSKEKYPFYGRPLISYLLEGKTTMDRILAEIPKDVPVFVDFHAEATSEKITMGYYLDGRVTALAGTHTHVQTSDALVLPKGTAYLTDLGMTGPYISSIGRDLKPVTRKFITGMPSRFEVAEGPCVLEGALIEFDPATKKAISIEPFRVREPFKV